MFVAQGIDYKGFFDFYTTSKALTPQIHSGVISTASVLLMNSSFLSIVCRAPRTLPATSAEPRCSTQSVSSMMATSRASWFSLILNSREGSRSEFGIDNYSADEGIAAVAVLVRMIAM